MAIKRELMPVVYVFLFMCFAVTLIIGALAWARTSSSFLPLPEWLPAIATLLSPITALGLAAHLFISRSSNRNANSGRQHNILSIIDQLHSVLSTVIATIALTYLFPDNILLCRVEQQWQSYFQSRNADAIRTIQDRFQCCGLRSIHDRAWPFKDRNHGDNACEEQLGYQSSCLVPWRAQQQSASWMIFAAAVLVWGVKIGVIYFNRRPSSWMTAFSSSREPVDYQRITHPELPEESGNVDNVNGAERAFLPHTRPAGLNEWTEN